MNKPKKLWANAVNHYGLWFTQPQRLTWDDSLQSWWHKNGNFDISKIGLDNHNNGYISFSSESKKEVEIWTMGIKAITSILRTISHK